MLGTVTSRLLNQTNKWGGNKSTKSCPSAWHCAKAQSIMGTEQGVRVLRIQCNVGLKSGSEKTVLHFESSASLIALQTLIHVIKCDAHVWKIFFSSSLSGSGSSGWALHIVFLMRRVCITDICKWHRAELAVVHLIQRQSCASRSKSRGQILGFTFSCAASSVVPTESRKQGEKTYAVVLSRFFFPPPVFCRWVSGKWTLDSTCVHLNVRDCCLVFEMFFYEMFTFIFFMGPRWHWVGGAYNLMLLDDWLVAV